MTQKKFKKKSTKVLGIQKRQNITKSKQNVKKFKNFQASNNSKITSNSSNDYNYELKSITNKSFLLDMDRKEEDILEINSEDYKNLKNKAEELLKSDIEKFESGILKYFL